jgi:hypothetical protein
LEKAKLIKSDEISNYLTLFGILIPIFLFLFAAKDVIWLFPMLLCIAGLAIEYWLTPRRRMKNEKYAVPHQDDNPQLVKNIFAYVIIALASLVAINAIVPNFLKISNLEITGMDAILFGIMMAIGEERLFRGGLFHRIHFTTKSYLITTILTALLFTVYHLAVYGNDYSALIYVLSAGMMLAFINIIAGVKSPSLLAHIGANILAYSPISLNLNTMQFGLDPSFILIIGAGFALIVIMIIVSKRRKIK